MLPGNLKQRGCVDVHQNIVEIIGVEPAQHLRMQPHMCVCISVLDSIMHAWLAAELVPLLKMVCRV